MVTAIDRKLWRDLARLWGQALTIALVVACGVAGYVTLYAGYRSIGAARDVFYAEARMPDVFAKCKRAPETLAARVERVPGVAVAYTRLSETVMLPLDDMPEPAMAALVSVPAGGVPPLGALALRGGRMVEHGVPDEVVVLESFARAHGVEPGGVLPVVINGILRKLRVVGVAQSPEYVFSIGAGEFIQNTRRFGVLWMDRDAIAPAFQMDDAFDEVVVALQPGANVLAVTDALDRLLRPYGGFGAHGRNRQASNAVLDGEITQLGTYAAVLPLIFLSVAAFLVSVVLSRLVRLQRGQIATLKAVGYTNREIGLHYVKLVSAIVAAGAGLGLALGAWLAGGLIDLYRQYFQFPSFGLRLDADVMAVGVVVSFAAGFTGAFATVRRVARLPPAEAMHPEPPAKYGASWVERAGLARLLDPEARMILRELVRRPLRTAMSCVGIALSLAIIITGRFGYDAFDVMIGLEFEGARRDDVTVMFTSATAGEAQRDVAHLPGVTQVEARRYVPVRMRAGHVYRDLAITGHTAGADLGRIVEWPPRAVEVPRDGLLVSATLARILGVGVGDKVTVDVLEGDRRTRDVVISGVVRDVFGLNAHMDMRALHALLDEEDVVSGVALTVDPNEEDRLDERLKELPRVASVLRRKNLIEEFRKQSGSMATTTTILTLFGATIAIGIVYNQARIALSARARDLASLRVLGFTRREISSMLLGELAAYVLVAVPLGMILGEWLTHALFVGVDPETYRLPVVVSGRTYVFSIVVTLLAAIASSLVVRKSLDHLDLVEVLKTRE